MLNRRRMRRSGTTIALLLPITGISIAMILICQLHIGLLIGFASAAFGAYLWYRGAQFRLAQLHRWNAVSNLYTLTPTEFEIHVAQTYGMLGYKTTVTARVGDQGIDVIAIRGAEKLGIQCKRSNDPVSNGAVQEAYAGKAHYGCTHGVVIALGGFTTSARSLSTSTGVTLIDGSAYADLFHRAQGSQPKRSAWTVIPPRLTIARVAFCAAIAAFSLAAGIFGIISA